jgi:Fic family protein
VSRIILLSPFLFPITIAKWRGAEPMQVVSGPIGRETIHYEAPPADRIDREMRCFINWWQSSCNQVEGILRAGIAHFWFVTIHPYEDGNGRLARALTDMALAQDEKTSTRFYSLSAQIMAERNEYYDVLERSQRGTPDITDWLFWFLGCFSRAVIRSKMFLGFILLKAKFWQQHGAEQLNDRQRKVINRLLDAGPGGFIGNLTTRKYVSMAKTSRATAYREITDLLSKGILRKKSGKGRNVSYELNWPAD